MSERGEPHVFVQTVEGQHIREVGRRAEWGADRVGWVVEAAYLSPPTASTSVVQTASGWGRWWRELLGLRTTRREAHPIGARMKPPFDEAGRDALGLVDMTVPPVARGDRPESGVRRVRGEVTSLSGDRGVVLRELWSRRNPSWRLVELKDFAVVSEGGVSVIVSCGLAPLTIAVPVVTTLGAHRRALGAEAQRKLPSPNPSLEGFAVAVESGTRVDVLGVVRPLGASRRAFAMESWGRGYREPPPRPDAVLGDEDGTRLVIAVVLDPEQAAAL